MLYCSQLNKGVYKTQNTELQNNLSQLFYMAFHVMFLFIWLAMAMDYTDSSLVARAKLLLQSRNEAKQLPRPLLDKFLVMWVDSMLFQFKYVRYTHTHTHWKQHTKKTHKQHMIHHL